MTPEWNEKRQLTTEWLLENFPKTFKVMKPLKVGIFKDIRALEIDDKPSNVWLRRALHFHTAKTHYLEKMIEGTERIDLEGEGSGLVSADDEKNAKITLAERKAYYQAQKDKKKAWQERVKKIKALKAKKNKEASEKAALEEKEKINEVTGRKILSLKKKPIKATASLLENLDNNSKKTLLKIKKKKSLECV